MRDVIKTHWEVRYYAPIKPWKEQAKPVKGGVRLWRAQFGSLEECNNYIANNELEAATIWKDGERYEA